MKECKQCGVELHGLQKMYCSRRCKNIYIGRNRTEEQKENCRSRNRELYKIKRDERLKQKAEYYQDNREDIIRKNTQHKKDHPEANQKYDRSVKGRYRDYKNGAKSRNLSFSLTLEQFTNYWEDNCYYCGDKIEGIGLDRVDNDIGYNIDNIVPCCGMCNIMRNRIRQQDFINQCNKITINLK